MRAVVIDTNCLLQMISRHSNYYVVWRAFREGKYFLCVSNEIISEYEELLSRVASPFVADGVLWTILNSKFCMFFSPQYHFQLITQDPDDNKFVDCAIIANADYIVTNDSHFKVLENIEFPKVNVKTIDQFVIELYEDLH